MKRRKTIIFFCAIVLSLVLTISPLLVNAQQEEEPPCAPCIEGQEPLPMYYGQYTCACQIDEDTDLDRFTFNGVEGDVVHFNLSEDEALVALCMGIRNPAGGYTQECYATPFSIKAFLGHTGTYQIEVWESGLDAVGPYTLQLDRILPNERCLEPDVPLNDEINPKTDTDSFSIYHTGSGETLVRINLSEEEANLALCLDVWSPSRIHVKDTDCYATSFFRDVLLTEEGEYGVAISDSGLNGIGSYTVEIQCLSGNCPLSCTDEDTDLDGILDNQDNCPNHPNGPALGTCTSGPYELIGIQTCTNNEECDPNGFCSMNQEDIYPPGGNGIGDACECDGDLDKDKDVDADDVTMFLQDFGRSQFNNPCP